MNEDTIKLIESYAKKHGYDFDENRLELTNGTPENGNTIMLDADGSVTHYCNGLPGYTEWYVEDGEFILI